MSLTLKSPQEVGLVLRDRFRQRRLAMNLSQSGLATRSGVNLHSLRRFEKSGLISLESLLKLALVLECLDDFDTIAPNSVPDRTARSLDQILASSQKRNRGRLS